MGKMKKSSFKQGAFIATFAIILTKIIGIVYVVPFYKVIGEQGGALYGYAYTIYATFLSISTVGIPLAISKLVSEYNALGYYHTRERVYKQGRRVIMAFAIIIFALLFIFAEPIAKMIIGDIEGGNTIEDIVYVIRVIATAILVIPPLSVSRGYLQGNKYMTESSLSQVIEQLFRVAIVVFGSYFAMKLSHDVRTSVAVACFGATIGGIFALIYLIIKIKTNKDIFLVNQPIKEEEKKISTKEIWIKIIKYAVPFILIDAVGNACALINMFTVVKILVNYTGYTITKAETVMGVLTTWGVKLNQIIIAIATGLVTSLLPHITSSYVKNDMESVNKRVNEAYTILLYFGIPMTIGLSFLAKPVWEVFYQNHGLAASVFSIFIFAAIASSLYTVTLIIMQSVNKYKVVFIALAVELVLKAGLQYPLMVGAYKLGLPPYVGTISGTLISLSSTYIISIIYMIKKMKISMKDTFKGLFWILFGSGAMLASLFVLRIFIDIIPTSRTNAIMIIAIYAVVGGIIYFIFTYKPLFKTVIARELMGKIKKIFKKSGENNEIKK